MKIKLKTKKKPACHFLIITFSSIYCFLWIAGRLKQSYTSQKLNTYIHTSRSQTVTIIQIINRLHDKIYLKTFVKLFYYYYYTYIYCICTYIHFFYNNRLITLHAWNNKIIIRFQHNNQCLQHTIILFK